MVKRRSKGTIPVNTKPAKQKDVITDRTYIIAEAQLGSVVDKRHVIGHAICPDCNQKVQVANERGATGGAIFDYALDHTYAASTKLCVGSNRRPILFLPQKKQNK